MQYWPFKSAGDDEVKEAEEEKPKRYWPFRKNIDVSFERENVNQMEDAKRILGELLVDEYFGE